MRSCRDDRLLHDRHDAPSPPPLVAQAQPGRHPSRGRRRRRGCGWQEDGDLAVAGGPHRPGPRAAPHPLRRGRGLRDRVPARRDAAVRVRPAGPGREARPRQEGQRPVGTPCGRRRGTPPRRARWRRLRDGDGARQPGDRVRRERPARCTRLRGRRRAFEGPQGGRRRGPAVRGLPDPPLGSLSRAAAPAAVCGDRARRRGPDRRPPRPRARRDRVHLRRVRHGHRPRRHVRRRASAGCSTRSPRPWTTSSATTRRPARRASSRTATPRTTTRGSRPTAARSPRSG